jgi:hypothetical protein
MGLALPSGAPAKSQGLRLSLLAGGQKDSYLLSGQGSAEIPYTGSTSSAAGGPGGQLAGDVSV